MRLRDEKIHALLEAADATRDAELDCDEFLDRMAAYAELRAAGRDVPDAWRLVEEHERLCANCREECAALVEMLQGR